MPGDVWSIPDFYPMAVIPNGVRLTASGGDLPAEALQRYVDLVEAGRLPLKIHQVGKLVVRAS
ncbi:hypothetical protein [Amycolatopsis sp. cmx-11-12]|uniref:hypothetical protein n=1 Tax=Amycolatopsis sp. cmx-11-12 TaxID=2785795 RepID=UPI003916E89B